MVGDVCGPKEEVLGAMAVWCVLLGFRSGCYSCSFELFVKDGAVFFIIGLV